MAIAQNVDTVTSDARTDVVSWWGLHLHKTATRPGKQWNALNFDHTPSDVCSVCGKRRENLRCWASSTVGARCTKQWAIVGPPWGPAPGKCQTRRLVFRTTRTEVRKTSARQQMRKAVVAEAVVCGGGAGYSACTAPVLSVNSSEPTSEAPNTKTRRAQAECAPPVPGPYDMTSINSQATQNTSTPCPLPPGEEIPTNRRNQSADPFFTKAASP